MCVWLSKDISNDSHIIGTPTGIFLTRSIRRLPTSFDLDLLGELTASPWNYGCASLGHRLVHAKRVVPPPAVAFDSSLRLPDKDAKAVQDYAYAKAHPSRMLTKLQFLGCWDKLSSRRMVSKNPFSMSRGWKRP